MRARNDRDEHVEQMVRDNEGDLLRYFQRRVQNPSDAAEAFGEMLLTAWRLRRKMPNDPVESRMWLFVIARNVMLNARRSVVRRSAAIRRMAQEMSAQPQAIHDNDLASAVQEAISALSPDQAEIIRLVYWDGFRSHEVAAILGIPASTARSRLSKARDTLRESLDVEEISWA